MYPPVRFDHSLRGREERFWESHRDLLQNPAALVDSLPRVRRTVFMAPQMSPLGSGGNGGGVVRWDPQQPFRVLGIPRCRRINPARDPLYYQPRPQFVGYGSDYSVRGWRRPSYPIGTDPQALAYLDSTNTYSQPYATRNPAAWRPFTWMF